MNAVRTSASSACPEQGKGPATFRVSIHQDESYDSPRDWDNAGLMYLKHHRHMLGDREAEDPYEEVEGTLVDGHFLAEEERRAA